MIESALGDYESGRERSCKSAA